MIYYTYIKNAVLYLVFMEYLIVYIYSYLIIYIVRSYKSFIVN